MTREEKIKYLKAVRSGAINQAAIHATIQNNFTRVSPVVRDEISVETGEPEYSIDPNTEFTCDEDGKTFTWQDINKMAEQRPTPIALCSVTENDEPFAIASVRLFPMSKEDEILMMLNKLNN